MKIFTVLLLTAIATAIPIKEVRDDIGEPEIKSPPCQIAFNPLCEKESQL